MKEKTIKPLKINKIKTKYFISNKGNIYYVTKDGNVKERKTRLDKDGYNVVVISVNKKRKYCRVCRLVCYNFNKKPKALKNIPYSKLQVNHKNGIHTDDSYTNLEWCTCRENILHAWHNGLSVAKMNEEHPNSVYSNDEIKKVCELLQTGQYSYLEIEKMTNVTYTVIKQIKNHVIWNDISKNYIFPDKVKRSNNILSKEDVIEICKLIEKGCKIKDISKKFNTTSATISAIKNHQNHIEISKDFKF